MKDKDVLESIVLKIDELQQNSLADMYSEIPKCIDICSNLLLSIQDEALRFKGANLIVEKISQLTIDVIYTKLEIDDEAISQSIPIDYTQEYRDVYIQIFNKLDAFSTNEETPDFYMKKKSELKALFKRMDSRNGCYIATMAYGDYDHPQVIELRNFRDEFLDKSTLGRGFIKIYYKYSPILVERLKDKPKTNILIRKFLNQLIKIIKK